MAVIAIKLSDAEEHYNEAMSQFPEFVYNLGEIGCVGAGLGCGFENTQESHVIKYDEATQKDPEHWQDAVQVEHKWMVEHLVFEPKLRTVIPKDSKILTSTWAMKKKPNRTYCVRLNARDYEQVHGVNFDKDTKAAPMVNRGSCCFSQLAQLFFGVVRSANGTQNPISAFGARASSWRGIFYIYL